MQEEICLSSVKRRKLLQFFKSDLQEQIKDGKKHIGKEENCIQETYFEIWNYCDCHRVKEKVTE